MGYWVYYLTQTLGKKRAHAYNCYHENLTEGKQINLEH